MTLKFNNGLLDPPLRFSQTLLKFTVNNFNLKNLNVLNPTFMLYLFASRIITYLQLYFDVKNLKIMISDVTLFLTPVYFD